MSTTTETIARHLAYNDSVTLRRVDRFNLAVRVTMRGITPTGRNAVHWTSSAAYGRKVDRDKLLQRAYDGLRPHTLPIGYTWGDIVIKEVEE